MYNYAERGHGKVLIYLSHKYPSPPPVPFELQTFITPEEWQERIQTILKTVSHYSKVFFERAWTLLALIATFVVPVALWRVIYNSVVHIPDNADGLGVFSVSAGDLLEARLITFAVFLGTVIVFWGPIGIWKYIGRRHMRRILNRWADADKLAREAGVFVPMWHVKTPGVFDDRTILTVTTPPPLGPSNFGVDYLPPYAIPGVQYPPHPQEKAPAYGAPAAGYGAEQRLRNVMGQGP